MLNMITTYEIDFVCVNPLPECSDGGVWGGEVQRRSAETLEVLALQTAHRQTEVSGYW